MLNKEKYQNRKATIVKEWVLTHKMVQNLKWIFFNERITLLRRKE